MAMKFMGVGGAAVAAGAGVMLARRHQRDQLVK
jgi:hypothetical protein